MYKVSKELKIDLKNKNSLGRLFALFNGKNYELYLVGGCVRDLLLGKEPKDFDLCTNATPDEIKKNLCELISYRIDKK